MEELERLHGAVLRRLAADTTSEYKIFLQLRARTPPVFTTRAAVVSWRRKYGDIKEVLSAGHLELQYGSIMRDAGISDAQALRDWLAGRSVKAALRICQKWITTDWSTSGNLLTPRAVEDAAGEQLRLDEYAERLAGDVYASAEVLSERQPPILVSASVLRQWYNQYHPASGPLEYHTAVELEAAMGGDMRNV